MFTFIISFYIYYYYIIIIKKHKTKNFKFIFYPECSSSTNVCMYKSNSLFFIWISWTIFSTDKFILIFFYFLKCLILRPAFLKEQNRYIKIMIYSNKCALHSRLSLHRFYWCTLIVVLRLQKHFLLMNHGYEFVTAVVAFLFQLCFLPAEGLDK